MLNVAGFMGASASEYTKFAMWLEMRRGNKEVLYSEYLDEIPITSADVTYANQMVVRDGYFYYMSGSNLYRYKDGNNELLGTVNIDSFTSGERGRMVDAPDGIHFVGGGSYSSSNNKHKVWDGSNFIDKPNAPTTTQAGNSACCYYNGKIHFIITTNHYTYDDENGWVRVGSAPYEARYSGMIVYNNELHMIGGYKTANTRKYHYKYDGNSWTDCGETGILNNYGWCAVYNNKLYYAGYGDNLLGYWDGSHHNVGLVNPLYAIIVYRDKLCYFTNKIFTSMYSYPYEVKDFIIDEDYDKYPDYGKIGESIYKKIVDNSNTTIFPYATLKELLFLDGTNVTKSCHSEFTLASASYNPQITFKHTLGVKPKGFLMVARGGVVESSNVNIQWMLMRNDGNYEIGMGGNTSRKGVQPLKNSYFNWSDSAIVSDSMIKLSASAGSGYSIINTADTNNTAYFSATTYDVFVFA